MLPEWKGLEPHRPLNPGDSRYISAPGCWGRRIASLIDSGASTILVHGPGGVGKSTELAQATSLLRERQTAIWFPMDREVASRRVTSAEALLRVAIRLLDEAQLLLTMHEDQGVGLDTTARSANDVLHAETLRRQVTSLLMNAEVGRSSSHAAITMLDESIRVLSARSSSGRVCLLLDGLEKVRDDVVLEVFDGFAALRQKFDLVAVVPVGLALSPLKGDLVCPAEDFIEIRAPAVEGEDGETGRIFLNKLLGMRTSLEIDAPMMRHMAEWSGGLPRVFLKLVTQSLLNAQIRHSSTVPDEADLHDALLNLVDSFRFALEPQDKALIMAVDGTDGAELDRSTRIRLLTLGLLLHRQEGDRVVLRPHPLVRSFLMDIGHA